MEEVKIEFITENFHDTRILSVIENTSTDEIHILVDFPVDWHNSLYEKKKLVFENAFNYQVYEMRFQGNPSILEIEVMEKGKDYSRFSLITNAGRREISCESVELID